MSNLALSFSLDFVTMECGECHVSFAVTKYFYDQTRLGKHGWYCPNGHSRSWAESEVDKIKKQLEAEKNSSEFYRKRLHSEINRTTAYKGVITKIKNRISNGVCPCCKRTFQNLLNHMKNKHPDFRSDDK
jgi:hypothetical protein